MTLTMLKRTCLMGDALLALLPLLCALLVAPLPADELLKAVGRFREAAVQGDAEAQNNLGNCYDKGYSSVERNPVAAVVWWSKAADQGVAMAQYSLGRCYANGEGVNADMAEAVKYYRKAAELGAAVAQDALGKCLANGEGVERNEAEAAKWFRRAADQGYLDAQVQLGKLSLLTASQAKHRTAEGIRLLLQAAT
ncbi:MAG: sel1 repeat family protein, partial [Desulfovibrio sp.]|nr:sel1 repeat family protein [Desulfovibrio sp.]